MPQFGPVSVEDTATPVAIQTFTPVGIDGGVAKVVKRTGSPVADPRMSFTAKTSAGGREIRAVSIVLPVMQDQVVGGVSKPTVVRTAYVKVELSFDASSTRRERADALRAASTITYPGLNTNNAKLEQWWIDLEGFY